MKYLGKEIFNEEIASAKITKVIFEKNQIAEIKRKFKTLGVKMRLRVANEIKRGITKKKQFDSFNKFFNLNSNKLGEDAIKKFVTKNNHIIDNWKTNKNIYPYFTQWIKALSFTLFYSMAFQNKKIDENAQEDIAQLFYLTGVDTIVTDDKGFMKDAFTYMYDSDKNIMTLDEFLKHINS